MQEDNDLKILSEACQQIKVPEKRSACLGAIERLGKPSSSKQSKAKSNAIKKTKEIITFKGIPLDKPGVKEQFKSMCKQEESNVSSYRGEDSCSFAESRSLIWLSYGILSHHLGWITLSNDESLLSVEISGLKSEMYALAEVLTAKYGEPEKVASQVENKMGNKFDKDIFVWVDEQGSRITVESMYSKVDEGRVLIESQSTIATKAIAEKLLYEASKENL